MRKALGYFLVSIPFLVGGARLYYVGSLRELVIVFGGAGVIIALVVVGVWFIETAE